MVGTVVLLLAPVASAQRADVHAPTRGEYLFRIAGCANCHTDREAKGPELAGGRAIRTAFGTFYTPNITPDRDSGIGTWTDAQFLRAVKAGIAPDGGNYYPSFPYTSYADLRRDDVLAIKEYLFSRAPVARHNRDHDMPWYLGRPLVSVWKWRYFGPDEGVEGGESSPRDRALRRGAFIANALAHCGECHTPRDSFGGPDRGRRFAGTRAGPDDESVPNITSDKETGIGSWSDSELKEYLKNGMDPSGDFAGGVMAEVIDNGLQYLRKDDLDALVVYLRSVPKVRNQLTDRKPKKQKSEWE